MTAIIWETIGLVTSGFALVAFMVATAAWLYRQKIIREKELIEQAGEKDRGKLVLGALEFFQIDTGNLTKERQYDVAIEQIRSRSKRSLHTSIVVGLVAIATAIVAVVALNKPPIENSAYPVVVGAGEDVSSEAGTDDVSNMQGAPAPVTTNITSINRLRKVVDTNLNSCWSNQIMGCELAAEHVESFCQRLDAGETAVKTVPEGFCDGLAEALIIVAEKLQSQDPECIKYIMADCGDPSGDGASLALCMNVKAKCVGTANQIKALMSNAKTKAGITFFQFSPSSN